MNNKNWNRTLGLIGIFGGIVLFIGDMLFYYDPVNTDLSVNMSNVSDLRIKLSGVSALIGVWFYCLGLVHVRQAFLKSSSLIRNTVITTFAGILISYGVIHAAYVAIAVAAKLSVAHGIDLDLATTLAKETNQLLRLFIYPLFGLLSIVFIKEVWQKRTLYPRWMILFFPLVPFLLQGTINGLLSGTLKSIVMGGYLNLMLVVFFLASTIALWHSKLEEKDND